MAPHDEGPRREYWLQRSDYIHIMTLGAFKMDVVTWLLPFMLFRSSVWSVVLYLLYAMLFAAPVLVIQSFLGQFSGSSYVGIFRMVPMFKGIGHLSVFLNYFTLAYQSIFCGIPLLFLVNSFRLVLPWSCEGYLRWRDDITGPDAHTTLCDVDELGGGPHLVHNVSVPSLLYLRSHFQHVINDEVTFSWSLFACISMAWIVAGAVVCNRAAVFGQIIRYGVVGAGGLLVVVLLRCVFLRGSLPALLSYFRPDFEITHWPWVSPVVMATLFGPGWGTAIAMASHNRFDTNILRYGYVICALQTVLMLLIGMLAYLVEMHLAAKYHLYADRLFYKQHWEIILSAPSVLVELEAPHLWCIMFFTMLALAGIALLAVQLYALVATVTEEFPRLRPHRGRTVTVIVLMLVLSSIFFSFDHPTTFFSALSTDTLLLQITFNVVLILMTDVIYGRHRFQRDFEFMLRRPFPTWLVYVLRLVAPLYAAQILWYCYLAVPYQHSVSSIAIQWSVWLFIVLPFAFIPTNILLQLLRAAGSMGMRLKRIVRPVDWYPLELDERWRYIDTFGESELSYQLLEMNAQTRK